MYNSGNSFNSGFVHPSVNMSAGPNNFFPQLRHAYDTGLDHQQYSNNLNRGVNSSHDLDLSSSVPLLDRSSTPERQRSSDSQASSRSDSSDTAIFWTGSTDTAGETYLYDEPESYYQHGVCKLGDAINSRSTIPFEHSRELVAARSPNVFDHNMINPTLNTVVRRSYCEKHHVLIGEPYGTYAQCVCGNAYRGEYANTNLARHIRNEKKGPFICELCFKAYSRSDNLKSHVERSHRKFARDSQYPCKKCWMSFAKKVDLDRHMQNDHQT